MFFLTLCLLFIISVKQGILAHIVENSCRAVVSELGNAAADGLDGLLGDAHHHVLCFLHEVGLGLHQGRVLQHGLIFPLAIQSEPGERHLQKVANTSAYE